MPKKPALAVEPGREVTVPEQMIHWCAGSYRRAPNGSMSKDSRPEQVAIKTCVHRYFNEPGHAARFLVCGDCPAIKKHLEIYGTRTTRRVPVDQTGHKLVFTDERTGKDVVTTTREWKKIERAGSTWFTKRINGEFHVFDLWAAQKMGIDGSYPKAVKVVMPKMSNGNRDQVLEMKEQLLDRMKKYGEANGMLGKVHEEKGASLGSLSAGSLLSEGVKKLGKRKLTPRAISDQRLQHIKNAGKRLTEKGLLNDLRAAHVAFYKWK